MTASSDSDFCVKAHPVIWMASVTISACDKLNRIIVRSAFRQGVDIWFNRLLSHRYLPQEIFVNTVEIFRQINLLMSYAVNFPDYRRQLLPC